MPTWAELQKQVFETAEAKGFHDGLPFDMTGIHVREALIHTEIAEISQIVKRHGIDNPTWHSAIVEECADVAIRILEMKYGYGEKVPHDLPAWNYGAKMKETRYGVLEMLNFVHIAVAREKYYTAMARIALLAEYFGGDLQQAILAKDAHNRTRPHRYGTPEEAPACPGAQ